MLTSPTTALCSFVSFTVAKVGYFFISMYYSRALGAVQSGGVVGREERSPTSENSKKLNVQGAQFVGNRLLQKAL